jgi:hypothetical protein
VMMLHMLLICSFVILFACMVCQILFISDCDTNFLSHFWRCFMG